MSDQIQANQPAASTRIRDNQRRSRARRKEYIHELEQRLQNFERLGVIATTEVQAAARKVSRENSMLRSLLRQYGVSDTKVEDYLHDPTHNLDSSTSIPKASELSPMMTYPSNDLESSTRNLGFEKPKAFTGQTYGSANQENAITTLPSPLPTDLESATTVRSACGPSGSDCSRRCPPRPMDMFEVDETDVRFCNSESQKTNVSMNTDDLTSCETAANIIASMRGQDRAEVRAELGCRTDKPCMVDNLTIFRVMDDKMG